MTSPQLSIAIAGPTASGKTAVFFRYLQLSLMAKTKYRLEIAHTQNAAATESYQKVALQQLKKGYYPPGTPPEESLLLEYEIISRDEGHKAVGLLRFLETAGICYSDIQNPSCLERLGKIFGNSGYNTIDYLVDSHAVLFFAGETHTTSAKSNGITPSSDAEQYEIAPIVRAMRAKYQGMGQVPQHFTVLLAKLDRDFDEVRSRANLDSAYARWTAAQWEHFREELGKKRLGDNYRQIIIDAFRHNDWLLAVTTVQGIRNSKQPVKTGPVSPIPGAAQNPANRSQDFIPEKMDSLFIQETIDGMIDRLIANPPDITTGRIRNNARNA